MQVKIEPSGAAPVPVTPGDDKKSGGAEGAAGSRTDATTGRDGSASRSEAADDASRLALSLRALAAQRSAAGEGSLFSRLGKPVDPADLAGRIRSDPSGAIAAQGAVAPGRALRLLAASNPEISPSRLAEITTAFENRLAATLEPLEVDENAAAAPLPADRIEAIRARIEAWRAAAPWAGSLG
ncbi:MAG: hypothetical protein NXI30_04960 [bacterium]|nr:hypothetical protein [bacterium]